MLKRMILVVVMMCLIGYGTTSYAEIIGEYKGAPVYDYDGEPLIIECLPIDADSLMEEMSGFSDPEKTLAEILSIMSILSELEYEQEEIIAGEYITKWNNLGYCIEMSEHEEFYMEEHETVEYHVWKLEFSPEVHMKLYASLTEGVKKGGEQVENLELCKIELNIIAPKLGDDRPVTVVYNL